MQIKENTNKDNEHNGGISYHWSFIVYWCPPLFLHAKDLLIKKQNERQEIPALVSFFWDTNVIGSEIAW